MTVLPLVLGLLASALIVGLTFLRSQKTIALATIFLSAAVALQYILLEQPTAATLNGMSFAFGILIYFTIGRDDLFSRFLNSSSAKIGLLVVYTSVFGALNGGFSWNLQLLAYIGSVLMVAVMMVSNAWLTKGILLAAGVCWTIFQFKTGAYGNLVGQVFYFGGLAWSIWRLARPRIQDTRVAELSLAAT